MASVNPATAPRLDSPLPSEIPTLRLDCVSDFPITGRGDHSFWKRAPHVSLAPVQADFTYRTAAKALWSETGLYFFVECEDRVLRNSFTEDFADLFLEDVVEIFLQPGPENSGYFEYEVSPLGHEIPLLVSQVDGTFHGWLPWKYTGPRKCRAQTVICGGDKAPEAECVGWSVECFIPFALLTGLTSPPTSGTTWRANFCRLDYDTGGAQHSTWSPAVGTNFHDVANFGRIVFL